MSLDDLTRRAEGAAPASPAGAHLASDVLARLRGDDERDEDADAFRHLASCAVCRARMVETEAIAIPSAVEARVVPIRRRWWPILAAAAAFLLVALALLRKPEAPKIAVSTRPFVGMMGTASASNVAPADMDLEVSFPATGVEAATLLIVSGEQRTEIAFVRDGDVLRVAIAPRVYPPGTTGVVLAGTAAAVKAVALAADPEAEAARRGVAAVRVKVR